MGLFSKAVAQQTTPAVLAAQALDLFSQAEAKIDESLIAIDVQKQNLNAEFEILANKIGEADDSAAKLIRTKERIQALTA